MSWSAIVGQTLAIRLFRQAIASDKLAHAYLFVGPEGVGKRTMALELAKVINCQSPGTDGACSVCSSCIHVSADPPSHPDIAVIQPDGRFIKTDQMRDLQTVMYARPNEGRHRVAVIDGADRLNPEAGNRVLKLLEEPPPYALFFLLTSNLAGVMPTIVSRCQVVNFPPLSSDAVAEVLVRQYGCTPQQSKLWAGLSGGSIGRAFNLMSQNEVLQRRDEVASLLNKICEMDDFSLIGYSETLEKQRDQLDEWLEMMIVWLRDALLVSQACSEALLINVDRHSDIQSLAQMYGTESLMEMVTALTEVRNNLQRNANSRLALDVMLLRLRHAAAQAMRLE